jgi:hypothetical protein
MLIAQVGLPPDELSTVTALVSSAPNLGGVLGVGIVGTCTCDAIFVKPCSLNVFSVINNEFRRSLSRMIPSVSGLDLNDVVSLVFSVPPGDLRRAIVKSYIHAWHLGWWVLAGVAVAQFILALFLRPVELSDGTGISRDAKVG